MSNSEFIKVGVFTHQRKSGKPFYLVYTTWYNPKWVGCCEHLVPREMRKDAKKIAIAEHKARCVDTD